MKVKLAIIIEEDLVKKIKLYAKENKTSVSKIADGYFKELLSRKKKSFVERASGIIKDISIPDIDKARIEYLSKKYNVENL